MAMLSNAQCPKCREALKQDAKFCGKCGEPIKATGPVCGSCQATNSAGAKFCKACGASLLAAQPAQPAQPAASAESAGNPVSGPTVEARQGIGRWNRKPGDFAVRVDIPDPETDLWNGFEVVLGERAMLFQSGKYVGALPPGRHEREDAETGILNEMRKKVGLLPAPWDLTVVVMDAGGVEMELEVGGLRTQENVPVDLECGVVLRLSHPESFFTNLMKGQGSVLVEDLRGRLVDEAKMVLQATLKEHAANDLYGNLELRKVVMVDLMEHMRNSLGQFGLEISHLRHVQFVSPELAKIAQERGDLTLYQQQTEVEMDRRGEELSAERGFLSLSREEVELEKEWMDLRERAEKIGTEAKMNELTADEELQAFKQEIDTKGLLRKEQWDELEQTLKQRRENSTLAREHFLEKLRLEQHLELEELRWDAQIELMRKELSYGEVVREGERAAQRHKLEMSRDDHREGLAKDWEAWEQENVAKREAKRGQEDKDHDQDMKEARDGMSLLRDVKAASREDDKEARAIEREDEEEKNRIRLEEQERRERIERENEIERRKAEVQAERDRLTARSGASKEALLSILGEGEAGNILKFEELRAKEGMTPEQMLAFTMDKSPGVFDALSKYYESQGTVAKEVATAREEHLEAERARMQESLELERKQMEARIADQKELRGELKEVQADGMQRLEELAKKSMEAVGGVAQKQAEHMHPTPGPVVVPAGGAGAGQVVPGDAGQAPGTLCPHCNIAHPPGTKYCPNTGKAVAPTQ